MLFDRRAIRMNYKHHFGMGGKVTFKISLKIATLSRKPPSPMSLGGSNESYLAWLSS